MLNCKGCGDKTEHKAVHGPRMQLVPCCRSCDAFMKVYEYAQEAGSYPDTIDVVLDTMEKGQPEILRGFGYRV